MGYRSEVKLITTKEGWSRIKKAVEDATPEGAWLVDDTNIVPVCDGKYVLGEWSDIKWYDWGDNIIGTFMKELGKLDEVDIPYEFMRVGEDYEDIEYLTYTSDDHYEKYKDMPNLELHRAIDVYYH